MESLKKNKVLITIFILALLAFLGYQFGGTLKNEVTDVIEVNAADEAATTEILTLLNQMQQAKIDSELFTSTAWANLVDYSISLPTDTPGRPDLFGATLKAPSLQIQARP
jgi:hypothetical protein